MNSHEVFIHIHQGCFAGTGAIVRLGNQSVYNHNKAQQSKNRVHISWDILHASVKYASIGSGNGLSPVLCKAIT